MIFGLDSKKSIFAPRFWENLDSLLLRVGSGVWQKTTTPGRKWDRALRPCDSESETVLVEPHAAPIRRPDPQPPIWAAANAQGFKIGRTPPFPTPQYEVLEMKEPKLGLPFKFDLQGHAQYNIKKQPQTHKPSKCSQINCSQVCLKKIEKHNVVSTIFSRIKS